MHILQVFLLKRCWENTELMWITLFFSRQCHFSGVKRAKKEQHILGEGVQFCRQFWRQTLVSRTDPGSSESPQVPLVSGWFYCHMPSHVVEFNRKSSNANNYVGMRFELSDVLSCLNNFVNKIVQTKTVLIFLYLIGFYIIIKCNLLRMKNV